jgi:hypothetical protein
MYENCEFAMPTGLPTVPGIETKVTPDKEEPIMPIEISTQLELRPAKKKSELLPPSLEVKYAMAINKPKYKPIQAKISCGAMTSCINSKNDVAKKNKT